MNFIKNNKLYVIGIIIGGVAGFSYYYLVGCESGYCAITSQPINSTLYGGMMGGLFVGLIKK